MIKEKKNLETVTFNAIGAKDLATALFIQRGLLVSGNYGNISNYAYNNEWVSKLREHFGDIYVANFDYDGDIKHHSVEAHIQDNLVYELKKNYPTVLSAISPTDFELAISILPGGAILCTLIGNGTISGKAIRELGEALDKIKALLSGSASDNQDDTLTLQGAVSINGILYTIKSGDTIYDICKKYDVDLEELLEANPWLRDRMSEESSSASSSSISSSSTSI